uniref:Dolichyl-diphosphooligosaccharide--protein glycosyltransferase subunit KCP2 n=1 Tax=Plectus sambesii TaxID=2011161 RepID=A0A914XEY1_9BILA
MAHGTSAVVALISGVLMIAAMQVFRAQLGASQMMTLLGGFIGSNVFVLLLTAISNFEMEFMGDNFKAGLIPEVAVALMVAVFASASVHRVCVTVCIMFSLGFLYVMNGISNAKYSPQTTGVATGAPIKKKK